MSDFDDLYERGLVDKAGIPLWDDDHHDEYNLKPNQYKVLLTPEKYLELNLLAAFNPETLRRELEDMSDSAFDVSDGRLEVVHDRYNEYDRLAIAVYYKDTFIGHIYKNHNYPTFLNKAKIESLCFENGVMRQLYLIHKYHGYILTIENEKKFNTNRKKSEKILFTDHNMIPLKDELSTLSAALTGLNLSAYEKQVIEKRIHEIKLKNVSNTSKKLVSDGLEGTAKVIEGSAKLLGGIFNLFKK